MCASSRKCHECEGTGIIQIKCPECHGKSEGFNSDYNGEDSAAAAVRPAVQVLSAKPVVPNAAERGTSMISKTEQVKLFVQ